jgi:arylsulfatase
MKSRSQANILMIFGDDIGLANIRAYSMGLMGYRTPNVDPIAREGIIFTDYYASRAARPDARHSSRAIQSSGSGPAP